MAVLPQKICHFRHSGGVVALALASLLGLGCGDDGPTPDAGPTPARTLQIVNPGGDSIGLSFSGQATLTVRYAAEDGTPIGGAAIEFELVATAAEETGGSALSKTTDTTSDSGIATADVTAGSQLASFRVEVSAEGAPSVFFFVAVSNSGFATLQLSGEHHGPRPVTWFSAVEYRLYLAGQLDCNDFDIDALPATVLPARSAPQFRDAVTIENLIAERDYVAVVWSEADTGPLPLSAGCAELLGSSVVVGPPLRATVAVTDRELDFSAPVVVVSQFDSSTIEAQSKASLGFDPWDALECPLGSAQLALDCALDAEVSDGALDCVVGGASALITAVEGLRGPVGLDGCRPAMSGGSDSLDKTLTDRMANGDWAAADATAIAQARLEIATAFELSSLLSSDAPATTRHQIASVRFTSGADEHIEDIVGSSRPVVERAGIESAFRDDGTLSLLSHSFTLDLSSAYRAAFASLALAPANLDDEDVSLGAAITASFDDTGAGTVGCAALSSTVCTAIAAAADCLDLSCQTASTALDSRLVQWFDFLDVGGLDVVMFGSASYADLDSDLTLETLGRSYEGPDVGGWTGIVSTTAGPVEVLGSFETP